MTAQGKPDIHHRVRNQIGREILLTADERDTVDAILAEEYGPWLEAAEGLARAIGHRFGCAFTACDCGAAATLAEALTEYERRSKK